MARRSGIRVWMRLGPGSGISMPVEELSPLGRVLVLCNAFLGAFRVGGRRSSVGAIFALIGLCLLPVFALVACVVVYVPHLLQAFRDRRAGPFVFPLLVLGFFIWAGLTSPRTPSKATTRREPVPSVSEVHPDEATAAPVGIAAPLAEAPTPKQVSPLTKAEIAETQKLLLQRGYPAGKADGIAGARSRAAAERFRREGGLPPGNSLDRPLLEDLRRGKPSS